LTCNELFIDTTTGEPVSVNYEVRTDLDRWGRPYKNGASNATLALKRDRTRVRNALRELGLVSAAKRILGT
jgi:hypothetical protein